MNGWKYEWVGELPRDVHDLIMEQLLTPRPIEEPDVALAVD
jgi:hypothetical protein